MHGDERGLVEGLTDAAFREYGGMIRGLFENGTSIAIAVAALVLGLLVWWLIHAGNIHVVVETSTTKSIAK